MAEESTDLLDDVVTRVHKHYREARDHTSDWRDKARESYDFEAGKQWKEEDLSRLNDADRPAVTIDRIARTLNAIIGTQINNRQETRFIPREQGDIQVNEILSSAGEWIRDEADAEDEESDAFSDLLVTGMGWTQTSLDYDDDPDGKIIIDRRDPLWMYWDPAARKKNLVDRRWNMLLRRYSPDEFGTNWPNTDLEAASAPWDDVVDDEGGTRLHTYPQDAYNEKKGASGKARIEIRVAHYEWWEYQTVWRVGNSAMRLSDADYQKLKPQLEERQIPVLKQRKRIYKQAFVAGNILLEEKAALDEEGFSYQCMTGRRDRNRNVWFGLVEVMKDPQRWGNKFFSQILDIINKNSKGGVMAEKTAVDDPRDFEEKWARPDAVHWVKDGAIAQKKIQPKPQGEYPQGLDRLMTFALDSVHEVTGVNLETLGLANRDQPGVLEQARKQAGLTILAVYFDSMRRYRKLQGRSLLRLIRKYVSDGRLVRIIGENGNEQYVPLVKQEGTDRFDVIVDESPTSPNQRERVFAALTEMLPSMVKMGLPMPPELLDYAPIPSALSQKWKEYIEQQSGGDVPDEVKKHIEDLTEENQKLKDKREEVEAELQLDREKAEEELALKRQEVEAESRLDREKTEEELELKREESHATFDLKKEEMEADIALARMKLVAEQGGDISKVKMGKFTFHPPKRKVSVTRRDANGFIADVEVVDVSDEMAV